MVGIRVAHDIFALLAHVGSLVALGIYTEDQPPFHALWVMAGTAVAFHAYYALRYWQTNFEFAGNANEAKWLEYAISATAGTLAVLTVKGMPSDDIVVGVVMLAIAQQACGFVIERCLYGKSVRRVRAAVLVAVASIIQGVEFKLVDNENPPRPLFWIYVFWWSFFGLHCFMHVLLYKANTNEVKSLRLRYNNREWVESVYACLGWGAKLSVFIAELAYLVNGELPTIDWHWGTINFVAAVLLAYTLWRPPYNSSGEPALL